MTNSNIQEILTLLSVPLISWKNPENQPKLLDTNDFQGKLSQLITEAPSAVPINQRIELQIGIVFFPHLG